MLSSNAHPKHKDEVFGKISAWFNSKIKWKTFEMGIPKKILWQRTPIPVSYPNGVKWCPFILGIKYPCGMSYGKFFLPAIPLPTGFEYYKPTFTLKVPIGINFHGAKKAIADEERKRTGGTTPEYGSVKYWEMKVKDDKKWFDERVEAAKTAKKGRCNAHTRTQTYAWMHSTQCFASACHSVIRLKR